MSARIITDPEVRVNNETYQLVPNSLTMVRGLGESEVKAQSIGNGQVENIFAENVETKVGKIKFSLYTTDFNIDTKIPQLKENRNRNTVSLADEDFTVVMKNAALVSDPEHVFSNDGQVELEFMGEIVR